MTQRNNTKNDNTKMIHRDDNQKMTPHPPTPPKKTKKTNNKHPQMMTKLIMKKFRKEGKVLNELLHKLVRGTTLDPHL